MSLKKQALSGMFWTTIQQFGIQGINFLVTIILTRLLAPEAFGLIGMLGIFMGLGTALINGGLTQSLIRTVEPDEEDYSTVFYFNLIGSIIVYLLIFVSAPLIGDFYKQVLLSSIIRIYGITFIINAFSAVQTTRLTKDLDFKTQMKVSIPSLIIGSLVGVSMAYLGFGVWSLVWSSIVQALASVIQLWYWSKWKPLWIFNKNKFKRHFHYGIKMMFSSFLETIFSNIYTIIIGRFFSPAQVGYYNRANTLQMFPVGNISFIVTKVTFPLFATIQNDDVKLKEVYRRIMQMVIFLVVPILVIASILAEPLFRLLFTEKWLPAVPYFQILCLNGILYPIHSYNLQILQVKGRSDLFLRLEILKKIVYVMILPVSFQFGIFGLLYGSVLASIICFFINTHYSGMFLKYTSWEQTKDLLPIFAVGFFVGISIFGIDSFFIKLGVYDINRVVAGVFLGAILYLGLAYLLKMSSLNEIIKIIGK